jgi:hypothetical protein
VLISFFTRTLSASFSLSPACLSIFLSLSLCFSLYPSLIHQVRVREQERKDAKLTRQWADSEDDWVRMMGGLDLDARSVPFSGSYTQHLNGSVVCLCVFRALFTVCLEF